MANRLWTFSARGGADRVFRFAALYLSTLVVNVAVNAGMVWLGGTAKPALAAAFVVATGLSACLNFLGMKFLVFRA